MTIKRKTSLLRAALLTALTATAILTFTGCQIFIVLAEKLFPKEKIPPRFVLPAGKTVLVFPDDMEHPLSYPPVKQTLADKVNELLVEHKLVAETVPYDKLVDLRNSEMNFNKLEVATVGRKLGADLVVYVAVENFHLKDTPIDTIWRGRFSVKVRVVDVSEGLLWPDESAGFPLEVVEPVTESPSEAYGSQLARKLAEQMGEKVSGLFHEHYVDRARPKKKETDSAPEW